MQALTHARAVKSDDTLWCWGSNANGRTGQNTHGWQHASTTQVSGGGAWSKVSLGANHSCALKSDNILWCWGSNGNGLTAQNIIAGDLLVPTAAAWTGYWRLTTSGRNHSCGVNDIGGLLCWGANTSSQAGNGNVNPINYLHEISGGGSWKQVSGGFGHTCAIKADDTLWCWGSNFSKRSHRDKYSRRLCDRSRRSVRQRNMERGVGQLSVPYVRH